MHWRKHWQGESASGERQTKTVPVLDSNEFGFICAGVSNVGGYKRNAVWDNVSIVPNMLLASEDIKQKQNVQCVLSVLNLLLFEHPHQQKCTHKKVSKLIVLADVCCKQW